MQINYYFQDPFGEKRGRFDYHGILKRLETTHARLMKNIDVSDVDDLSDSEHENEASNSTETSSGGGGRS